MVEWKRIKDICSNIFAGGTPSTKRKDYYDGDIPWIRSGEIDFNVIKNAERNITELGYKESSAKMIRKNSVVMAMTGATVAKSAVVSIETTANQSVCAMETDEKIANFKFVYYFLAEDYFKIKSSAQGALTSLNLAMIKNILIPIPSLSEQKRIVETLDTFTASIDNLKEQITLRKKQYEHYRDYLLSFEGRDDVEWKHIAEIKEDVFSGATPSTKEPRYWDGGTIPWMSSGEVHQGEVLYVEKKITEEGYNHSSTRMVPINSVVVALAGQGKTRGTVAITRTELCTNQSLCAIVTDKRKMNSNFLYYFLSSKYNELRRVSSGDGTRGGLNLQMINDFKVPVPSLSEQQQIFENLSVMTSLISALEQEKALRQKQYEYYREKLLTFE